MYICPHVRPIYLLARSAPNASWSICFLTIWFEARHLSPSSHKEKLFPGIITHLWEIIHKGCSKKCVFLTNFWNSQFDMTFSKSCWMQNFDILAICIYDIDICIKDNKCIALAIHRCIMLSFCNNFNKMRSISINDIIPFVNGLFLNQNPQWTLTQDNICALSIWYIIITIWHY